MEQNRCSRSARIGVHDGPEYAAGLSQKALGIKAGIDRFSASARMNQYETDKHVPDFGTVKRIAKILKIPTAYLYCEDDDLALVIKKWYLRKVEKK